MKLRLVNTVLAIFLMALFIVLPTGCGGEKRGHEPEEVVIGCKNFTEQLLLGELMAQVIEAETDLKVKRLFNLGGTMICHEGLVRGELDVYAEYTGTALTAILEKDVVSDPDDVYQVVSEVYASEYECEWLKPFGFNNTYAITVRADVAEKNGWDAISDLAGEAGNLTAGFTAEFMEREDGYPGLREAYGLEFGDIRDMEPSLMYQAIAQKNVDVICAFATDGRIAEYELVMLEDGRGFFPPYYAAPVARHETLESYPQLRKVLGSLGGIIGDRMMRDLNNSVDREKRDPAEVVREFLVEKGLIGKTVKK